MNATALTTLDSVSYASLPTVVRLEVSSWLRELREVRKPVTAALIAVAHKLGVSYPTARRKYDAWRAAGGDWRALINWAKVGAVKEVALQPETIAYWQALVTANQRKCRPAWRELIRRWRAGEEIPGQRDVGSHDGDNRKLPPGFSYGNLMRYKPTKFELTAARQGRSAAAIFRPMVYTTRANLWVGSHYVFDDMWHDHMVNILDTRQTGRPLEFHALDLFSACKFAWGMRVRTENVVTGKAEGLKEEMMRYLLISILADHGYSPRGTIFMVEHGTAAIREELERLLFDLSGGLIKIQRSGIDGDPAFTGQYAGRGKGNFRFKAALESLGNLIHNEMARLPGQTGMDVDRRPEGLHGLLKHNDALLNAMVALARTNPERAGLLRMPLLDFQQFQRVALDIYGLINGRTDHRLEGWAANVALDASGEIMRRLSPAEVWQAGRPGLIKLGPAACATLCGDKMMVERPVSGGRIEFVSKEISPDLIRYDAAALREGERYNTVLNPFAPARLYAFDARGGFVAECPMIERADAGDLEQLARAFGFAAKREAELLRPVAEQGRAITRRRIEDARHNAMVLAGAVDPAGVAPAQPEKIEDCTEALLDRAATGPKPESNWD